MLVLSYFPHLSITDPLCPIASLYQKNRAVSTPVSALPISFAFPWALNAGVQVCPELRLGCGGCAGGGAAGVGGRLTAKSVRGALRDGKK